jgi:hypothetical protein
LERAHGGVPETLTVEGPYDPQLWLIDRLRFNFSIIMHWIGDEIFIF